MLKKDIDIKIISELINQVEDDMNVLSIDLSDNNYKVHIAIDFVVYSEEKYNASLDELMALISHIKNYDEKREAPENIDNT